MVPKILWSFKSMVYLAVAVFLYALSCTSALAQQLGSGSAPEVITQPAGANNPDRAQPPDKRMFGVLPNYRTVEDTGDVEPLTTRRKFYIASKDSFDYPIYFLSGVFAGISQLDNQNPSFGQGLKGYGKRYGTAYVDQILGNMMTEAIVPTLLHEDPRYFRRGTGGKWGRTAYALTRIFVTRTDAGLNRINTSELLGNSMAVAISNAYYPATRNAADNLEKLALQCGTDALSNMLKEFWPDVKRKLHSRHNL
jgi:hypothetical protein